MDRRSNITPWDLECMLCDETAEPKALPLSLLEDITDNFSDERLIGSGGFAVVYTGMLENRIVAVKRMSDAYMDEMVFQREIGCLMMVKHKNVIRFLGYCANTQGSMERYDGKLVMADINQKLLCFEYLPRGSLHEYITDTSPGLRWSVRYQIITGICQGLHYLHQKNIVHLDLKPANILLDDNWVPKITDFGLSRCFDEMKSRAISKIVGTIGYLAPESFNHTEVTYRHSYRLDIYSLGVVIMEILTGEKGYHDVDNVVESWSKKVEKSQSDIQLKQVRICAEIATECIDSNPAKRPNTQQIIDILNEYIETDMITTPQINPDMLIGTMRALWLSYQQLNPNIRRCIEYCSIFPRESKLRKNKLVCQWIAQDYVKTSSATEELEDAAEGYIQELVSCSFLQPGKSVFNGIHLTDCFTFRTGVHDFLNNVARKCFRIENETSHRGKGWVGDVPRDVQHIFIQKYDAELITKKILGLENLSTLIIDVVPKDVLVEKEVIQSICKRLLKLRVLAFAFREEYCSLDPPNNIFSVPDSISQLKHLRYLAFRTSILCKVILPSTLNKLQHTRLLDFGSCEKLDYPFADLVTLRHIFCRIGVEFPNISRLTSLQTIPMFGVRNEQGYEVKQLRDLNKLCGSLMIRNLENVKSKEEALEANLAAKERLTDLNLQWETRYNAKIQAEVLEGLCPPMGLQKLMIWHYSGWRYPDWMEGNPNGGLKDLQHLNFSCCGQPGGLAPQLCEAFLHLRVLVLYSCEWDTLPGNMELLTSLEYLSIMNCDNIRSFPTLPQSLVKICLYQCDREFMKTCQTVGHPNWEKIKHVPEKDIDFEELSVSPILESPILEKHIDSEELRVSPTTKVGRPSKLTQIAKFILCC